MWTRIARVYKTLYVNEMLRVYWQDQPSLMRGGSPADNAAGGRFGALGSIDGTNRLVYLRPHVFYSLRHSLCAIFVSFQLGFMVTIFGFDQHSSQNIVGTGLAHSLGRVPA